MFIDRLCLFEIVTCIRFTECIQFTLSCFLLCYSILEVVIIIIQYTPCYNRDLDITLSCQGSQIFIMKFYKGIIEK